MDHRMWSFANLLGGAAVVLTACGASGLAVAAEPAPAQPGASAEAAAAAPEATSPEQRIRMLEQAVMALQSELAKVKAELTKAASRGSATAAASRDGLVYAANRDGSVIAAGPDGAAPAPPPPRDGSAVKVTTTGGLKVQTEDGNYSFQVVGRLNADANFHNEDKSLLGDGTAIRRARLGVGGTVNKVWDYKFEADFGRNAANTVGITDAYVAFRGFAPTTITIGHFKEPFSLEELTSSRFISFMERGLPNVFAPARHIGIGADTTINKNIFLAGGLFGDGVDSDPAAEGDEGMDIAARAAYAPIMDKDRLVHLGIGTFYRDPSDTAVAFSTRPETSITGTRWVNTGTLGDAEHVWAVDPELAVAYGPFSVQGEYFWVDVAREFSEDVDLEGWYAFMSWFLTGESRASMYKNGKFDALKPNQDLGHDGGIGAFELLARISDIDFDDGSALQAGHERNYSLGLTWYVNQYFKFMANYVWINNNNSAIGTGASAPVARNPLIGVRDDDPEVAMFRAAAYW